MVYSFAPKQFKPYVKELYTFQGLNVLRDAPHDHLHHHGLMYAIRVNGLNFWEEVSGNGVEKCIETSKPVLGWAEQGGSRLPQASFTQVLHWVSPQDAFLPDTAPVALLIERRTLTLTLNPELQEVALEWKSEFEVGTKTNTVVLTGTKYRRAGPAVSRGLGRFGGAFAGRKAARSGGGTPGRFSGALGRCVI